MAFKLFKRTNTTPLTQAIERQEYLKEKLKSAGERGREKARNPPLKSFSNSLGSVASKGIKSFERFAKAQSPKKTSRKKGEAQYGFDLFGSPMETQKRIKTKTSSRPQVIIIRDGQQTRQITKPRRKRRRINKENTDFERWF